MKFDVHRSRYPSSELGVWLATIPGDQLRDARERAEELFPHMAIVVVPHQKPTNAVVPRPVRQSKPDERRGGRRPR